MKIQQRKKQQGYSLVEIGIVMAIVAIGLFYAISKGVEMNNQSKSQSVAQDLASTIVPNAKRLYATQSSYTGVTIGALRDNNVFPGTWNVAGTITGPFTGAVTTSAATFVTAGDALTITVPNVYQSICSDIVRMMAGGIEQIAVGGTVVQAYQGTLNVGTLGTQCAAAASSSIAFTFGKM